MNILVPDSWLREYLETKATPKQIKEYLSLCGPSVERIHTEKKEIIYDIEVTSNRPDAMSIFGIAREAAAILPRFGIAATLVNDPYISKTPSFHGEIPLTVKTDPMLNPRWTSVVIKNVTVKDSPGWLKKKLEQTGIRALNNVIDITNYLMRAYGQPAHAFDYDQIGGHTMILRLSKKGETLTTLDGKTHTLPGGDIVIEDGVGRLIDLCGIMGAQNSSIQTTTTTVVLFLQTYDPVHIRRTSMALSARTQAATLFEKGIDSELVLPALTRGASLMKELAGGSVASKLYDIYPDPFKPYTVSVERQKVDDYIGTHLADKEVKGMLSSLGFSTEVSPQKISVLIPSYRRDIALDVDSIEELARIYGYHNITASLPDSAPPMTQPDKTIQWEEELKVRLRDWGYTEIYTYSMLSDALMEHYQLDKTNAYKITNPLSNEWVYMRPSLVPGMEQTIQQNQSFKTDLKLFELSQIYEYREGDLPKEKSQLVVAWSGNKQAQAKGLAEAIYTLFGSRDPSLNISFTSARTILTLDVDLMITHAKPHKQYIPPPKFPPVYEDFTFVVPPKTHVGLLIHAVKSADSLITDVSLLEIYENTRTLHVTYQSREKNLTDEDIAPVRKKLIDLAAQTCEAVIKA